MSRDRVDAESKVSGNQATIPATIRRERDIQDGDHLRWTLGNDGTLRVEIVQQRVGTLVEFDGYEGKQHTGVVAEHETWGTE